MRKCFTRAFALVMAVLMVASQMVFVAVADTAEQCVCDAETRTGEVYDHIDPTCGDYGYDLYVCDECGGTWSVLTDLPTGQHTLNIEKATCTEDMYCTECGEVLAEAIGHNYEETVVDATCDADGYTAHLCLNCGDYYETDVVPAIGHDWVEDEDASFACSCNVDGLTVYVCNNCDAVREEVIPAPGKHINYVTETVPATCYEDSYIIHTCNVCGYELIEPIEGSALGHDVVVNEAKPSTCTEDGWYEYETCTRCDYTTYEVDPADGHVEADEVIENDTTSTCEEDGSYDVVVYCATCGIELSRNTVVVPATNHERGDVVVENEVAPTCEEDGSYDNVVYCVKCDKELSRDTVVVPAIGHDFEITTVAPTCSARGYNSNVCLNCGVSYKDNFVEIDPFSHKGVLEGRVEATCTADGFTGSLVCEYCDRVLNRGVVIPMLPHELAEYDGKDADCTEIGWNAYVECANCDYTTYEEIPALGHEQVYSLGVVAPTCTEQGYHIWKCTRVLNGEECGVIYRTDIVDALGHTPGRCVVEDLVPATCTETGSYKEVTYCDVCFEAINTVDVVVPEFGHTVEVDAAVEPTCTETGLTEGSHCSVCDEVLVAQEVVEALGHDVVEDAAVAPTCTETGLTAGEHCARCEEVLVAQEVVPAAGHVAGRCVVEDVVPATCTETGSYKEVTYCDVCFEVIETVDVVVPEFGHTIVEDVTPATEEAVGYVDSYCSVCGENFGRRYLDEEVVFTYEASGINGDDYAVNSGYVTVKVFATVVSDFARMTGVDIDLVYDDSLAFMPELSSGASLFENFKVNSYDDGVVKFTVDNGIAGTKVYAKTQPEDAPYLVATLVFKVAGGYKDVDAVFSVGAECKVSRSTLLVNKLLVDFGTGVSIHVDALGDFDNDGTFSVADTNAFIEYFMNPNSAYDSVYDMDKNGVVDLDDLDLLRLAIVHDYEYLTRG